MHPLERHLEQYAAAQRALKLEAISRTLGTAEVVRREMEVKIVGAEWRPAQLGGVSGVHMDVLMGTDWGIEWEDVFKGLSPPFSFLAGKNRRAWMK